MEYNLIKQKLNKTQPPSAHMISIAMLTKDSAIMLKKVLEKTLFFDEVLILDTGSTDDTVEIARQFPHVKIAKSPFTNFGEMKNLAAKFAKNDWILSLDSDEILSDSLIKEILSTTLKEKTLYRIPRVNYFQGKAISGCGWKNDAPIRLYNKKITQFDSSFVHEKVVENNLEVTTFKNPLNHYPYRSTKDFLSKMQHYTSLYANQHAGKKNPTFLSCVFRGMFSFFKSYFLQKGFFLGKQGWIISVYNGQTTYYKYLKIWETKRGNHEGN